MLKQIYRKYVSFLEGRSRILRLRKQYIGELLEIRKINASLPVKGKKLSKEQIDEIQKYWKPRLGKKVPVKWHQKYYGYSGGFDPKFFPEIYYTTKLEPAMNPEMETKVLSDKNLTEFLFAKVIDEHRDIVVPKTLCGCSNRFYYGFERQPINKDMAIRLVGGGDRRVHYKACNGRKLWAWRTAS